MQVCTEDDISSPKVDITFPSLPHIHLASDNESMPDSFLYNRGWNPTFRLDMTGSCLIYMALPEETKKHLL